MFEQEINESIQRITRDILQDKTLIPLTEILEEQGISNRFKAFFETEVHWWIYTDAMTRKRDRRFDFAHPEIASLLNYLEQIQAKHARFERDEFLATLDKAVKLSYNYICRPQTTLKWYIFRGEPTKPLGETLLRLNAFNDYTYFRAVFTDWVDRKREERPTFDSISAREFERIVRRIDDQILLSCTIDELLEMMSPLFEFIGKGENRSVPIDALIIFFDDKHIARLVQFLEKEKERRTHVTPDSFAMMMDELLTNAEEEPDVDFSSVYQDDALDAVVREHLQGGELQEGGIIDPTLPPTEPFISLNSDVPSGEAETSSAEIGEVPEEKAAPVSTDPTPEETLSEEESAGEEGSATDPPGNDFFIGPDPLPPDSTPENVFAQESEEKRSAPATEPIIDILIEAEETDHESENEVEQEPEERGGNGIRKIEEIISGTPSRTETLSRDETAEAVEEKGIVENDEETDSSSSAGMEHEEEEDVATETSQEIEADGTADESGEDEEAAQEEAAETSETGGTVSEEEENRRQDEETSSEESAVGEEEETETASLEDVRKYIDAMLERKVVKKIFNRKREEYEKTLDLLNTADTWREASRILDELFIRFDVDPYSRTAIRFTDAVYGRYLTPIGGN